MSSERLFCLFKEGPSDVESSSEQAESQTDLQKYTAHPHMLQPPDTQHWNTHSPKTFAKTSLLVSSPDPVE